MSHLNRVISLRGCVGIAVLLGMSPAALAQSTQSLILAFDASVSQVPIGPWTSVAIALLVAGIAFAALRRRNGSRFAQLCLLAATGGALVLIPPAPNADANGGYILTTSPFTLTPVTCPLAQNDLYFQNGTGATTTIRGVTLTGLGACSLSGGAGLVNAPLAAPIPACVTGLALPNGGQCSVRLYNLT